MSDHDPNRVPGVPKILPEDWEKLGAFRETFLAGVIDAEQNETFREFGKLQDELMAGSFGRFPGPTQDWMAHQLQAATADLRHLQGFLRFIGELEGTSSGLDPEHARLCDLCRRNAKRIGSIADGLEKEVGEWQFKEEAQRGGWLRTPVPTEQKP